MPPLPVGANWNDDRKILQKLSKYSIKKVEGDKKRYCKADWKDKHNFEKCG